MEGKESTVSSPSAGELEIEPGRAAKEVNSTTPPDFAAPTPKSAKPVTPQKGSKNTPLTIASANSGVIIPQVRGGKQQLEHLPDTFVSARDTEIIDQLITATRALIADSGPVTKPCAKLKAKAGVQIAELRQHYFDTWAAIGANLSELRTASRTKGALGFNTICTAQLGLQRNKGTRLADCHESLIALPEPYQHALRELRKTATEDVVKKVNQVMAEGVSDAQIKNRLSAKFSRKGQDKPSAQESAKSKFLAALDSIKGHDARRSYCLEVFEDATRLVGLTFDEKSSVVTVTKAAALETSEVYIEFDRPPEPDPEECVDFDSVLDEACELAAN
jgi:hypothetical protein